MIDGFTHGVARPVGGDVAYSIAGTGPPVLLLHGFPQTRAMWARIAPALLAAGRTVVCADLRGYGASWKPSAVVDYSFRRMGEEMLTLMRDLGFERFDLVGHDRGARCAHRMALDAPGRVRTLTVMDIVPTHLLLSDLTQEVATAYYHWFFLAQPEPFPETLIAADPDYFYESCLLGWGAAELSDFDPRQLSAYRAAWRDRDTIRGMCNDYRAALVHDMADDADDLKAKVHCPALALYGAEGVMARAYDMGTTWAERCTDVRTQAIPGGHFFPDSAPEETTAALLEFLGGQSSAA
ncbi:MAG: alpha/beta hydrolase [Sediminimonas qiaohouensis]|uniref:Alpha/beta hydrolase n=1 Tax=Sediminimonas qiaohouensis TaxID=552061 RepID=A0A7C9L9W0_9RHOB|nr:alpha/beta hydrolase [Sediminimonas qiaohouensis]MTJ03538.1 alpha/beta hydrolase [Sediminimonas qiaohouensis]